jgi:hypothetical protein
MVSRKSFITLVPLLSLLGACSATGDPPGNNGGSGGGGAGGSGAGGAGGGGVTCPPDQNYNGAMPIVSLRNDLLADISATKPTGGVFRRACAASSCHDENRPIANLFVAPPAKDAMTDMPIMLTAEHVSRFLGTTDGVLRMSGTAPMPLVDPGKPWNSFLMRKLDNCFTDIASQCTPIDPGPPPCGESMPASAGMLLGADERDLVRRWIFQGAKPE